ncbi:MAG: DUF192 domain-containing protein [Actinobacteria bacterium]|nr:DUF192 domain-containing protein [Actinomycetota bacterium]
MRRAVAFGSAIGAAALLLAGCRADGTAPTAPDDRIQVTLDGIELDVEVADDAAERAIGLMNRDAVPPGTGMIFRYDQAVDARFYMFQVSVPLRAVFIRDGRVVSSVVMPPCPLADPQACPTYGADGPFDTVVETAPETLPDVAPGDVLTVE